MYGRTVPNRTVQSSVINLTLFGRNDRNVSHGGSPPYALLQQVQSFWAIVATIIIGLKDLLCVNGVDEARAALIMGRVAVDLC